MEGIQWRTVMRRKYIQNIALFDLRRYGPSHSVHIRMVGEETHRVLPSCKILPLSPLPCLTGQWAIRFESIIHPSEQSPSWILGDGITELFLGNPYVRMGYDRRWNKDCRPRWELNNKIKVPKNDMPPLFVIVGTKCGDRAPSKGGIIEVAMGYSSWTQIISRWGENEREERKL